MAHAPNFKLALTRVIVPTGGPDAELATLEDAARFVGLLRSLQLPCMQVALTMMRHCAQRTHFSQIKTATILLKYDSLDHN